MENQNSPPQKGLFFWYLQGVRGLISIPAFVLISAFSGFGTLARDAGLDVWQAMTITLTTWALPSTVLLAGSIASGSSFITTALTVAFASIRLMPMVMSIVPVLKSPKTRTSSLLAASWFLAITSWVHAMTHLPNIPRDGRLAFFFGFASSLTIMNTGVTGLAHMASPQMPQALSATLVLLTPIYFLITMINSTRSSKTTANRYAIILGLIITPILVLINAPADLLLCGFIGGTLAYFAGRSKT